MAVAGFVFFQGSTGLAWQVIRGRPRVIYVKVTKRRVGPVHQRCLLHIISELVITLWISASEHGVHCVVGKAPPMDPFLFG